MNSSLTGGRIAAIAIAAVVGVGLIISIPQLAETLDAREIMVIQSPFSGDLSVYTEPGMKAQMFGKVTKYMRREQYSFKSGTADNSIKIGFNDGGSGRVSGVMSWEMPLKPDAVIRLHKEYGSYQAIDQQLIRPMLEKVIFNAGATMSSIESSSERRPEIPQSIDDQLMNGPYMTSVAIQTQKDPITGEAKPVKVVQVVVDDKGQPRRASQSVIREYGITLSPVTINDISYEKTVTDQIAKRQVSTQEVQLSAANAVRATQATITTEQEGRAAAAKAKWEQETIKAKEVTLAQQKLEVAKLGALEAEQYKREQILRGEGEAARRQLVMNADGALDKKLETYSEVQGKWAEAFSKFGGQMVPNIAMGQNAGQGNAMNAMQEIANMTAIRLARDLNTDLSVPAGRVTHAVPTAAAKK